MSDELYKAFDRDATDYRRRHPELSWDEAVNGLLSTPEGDVYRGWEFVPGYAAQKRSQESQGAITPRTMPVSPDTLLDDEIRRRLEANQLKPSQIDSTIKDLAQNYPDSMSWGNKLAGTAAAISGMYQAPSTPMGAFARTVEMLKGMKKDAETLATGNDPAFKVLMSRGDAAQILLRHPVWAARDIVDSARHSLKALGNVVGRTGNTAMALLMGDDYGKVVENLLPEFIKAPGESETAAQRWVKAAALKNAGIWPESAALPSPIAEPPAPHKAHELIKKAATVDLATVPYAFMTGVATGKNPLGLVQKREGTEGIEAFLDAADKFAFGIPYFVGVELPIYILTDPANAAAGLLSKAARGAAAAKAGMHASRTAEVLSESEKAANLLEQTAKAMPKGKEDFTLAALKFALSPQVRGAKGMKGLMANQMDKHKLAGTVLMDPRLERFTWLPRLVDAEDGLYPTVNTKVARYMAQHENAAKTVADELITGSNKFLLQAEPDDVIKALTYKERARIAKSIPQKVMDELQKYGDEVGGVSSEIADFLERGIVNRIIKEGVNPMKVGAKKKMAEVATSYMEEIAQVIKSVNPIDNNTVGMLVREPMNVIPAEYAVLRYAQNKYESELSQDMVKYFDDLSGQMRNIKEGSEKDQLLFNFWDAERTLKKTPQGTWSVKWSPEREALFYQMDAETQSIARNTEAFFDEAAERLNLPPEKRISGYGPHLFKKEEFENGFPVELWGIRTVRNVMFQHTKPRTGAEGYERSAVNALKTYLTGYHRKLWMQPAINELQISKAAYTVQGLKLKANYTDMLQSQLLGKPGVMAEVIDAKMLDYTKMTGRTWDWGVRNAALGQAFMYYGMIGGSIPFFFKNLHSGTLNTAAKTGPYNTLVGLKWMLTPQGRQLTKELQLGERFAKMADIALGTSADEVFEKTLRVPKSIPGIGGKGMKLKHLLGGMAQLSENWNRGLALWAGMSQYAKENGLDLAEVAARGDQATMAKAIMRGINVSDETQFVYGTLGRSPSMAYGFSGGTSRAVAMFQSYYLKQGEFVARQMHDDWGVIARFFLYSGMAARAAANEFGIDASQYSGTGALVPEPRPDSPLFASPPVNLIAALFDFTNGGDSPEKQRSIVDRVERALAASVPFYMQAVRFGRNKQLKEVGDQKTLMEVNEPGTQIASAFGLPQVGTRQKADAMAGFRVEKDRRNQVADEMQTTWIKLNDALKEGKGDVADKLRERMFTLAMANGWDFDQMGDNIYAAQRGYELTVLMRAFARDPSVMTASGRIGELERAGIDWTAGRESLQRTPAEQERGGY